MNTSLRRALACLSIFFSTVVPALAQRATERFQNREVVSQEIIVRFREPGNAAVMSQSLRAEDPDIASSTPVGRAGAIWIRSRGRDVAALIQAYAGRPDVAYVEPNYVWQASDIPNDLFFGEQWALRNTGQVVGQSGTTGADIDAVQAWDVVEGSRGIVVGMIDSGIQYNHPDLVDNIWSAPSGFSVTVGGQTIQCAAGTHGFNAITRSCDPMDDDGHGTHTAGIVGASGNNALGTSGISRVASLMGLKFLDQTGQGTTINAIAAIEFAIEVKKKFPTAANLRVLNASWGGGAFSQALLDEINLAAANDMLFVAAAGNLGQDIGVSPLYPAAYNAPNLIAVAATDNRDQRASFSNFGVETVHLGAPGLEILSTRRDPSFGYGRASGTSSSAAMVSGAAALVLSSCGLSTATLKSTILETVDHISSMSGVTVTGGRLNVNNAIRNCTGAQPPAFTLTVPTAQTIALGGGNQISISVNALSGFAGAVNLSASNLPSGMSASFNPAVLSGGPSVLTLTSAGVAQGTYSIGITAAAGTLTRTATILITVGLPPTCSISLGVGSVHGRLDTTDPTSIHRPPAFADFCTFTLDDARAINVEMSAAFSEFIYLLSSSGQVIASNGGGSANARIFAELAAGTYTIEATSTNQGIVGDYDLYLRNTGPTISSVSPTSGVAGTSVDITIQGTAFVGNPFLVKISSCDGVIVTNVNVINSTTASARLTLPGIVANCAIGVSTPGGASSTLSFKIFPPPPVITGVTPNAGVQGETVTVTLTGTNFVSPVLVNIVAPDGSVQAFQSTTITPTAITLKWQIAVNAPLGLYAFRVQAAGGQITQSGFTVLLAPLTLTDVVPSGIGRGLPTLVTLFGKGITAPVQVNAGPEITVTEVKVGEFYYATAKFTVSPSAPFGEYPVTISTPQGTSDARVIKVLPPPTITSFTPGKAILGREFEPSVSVINLIGTNFGCGGESVTVTGTGVTGGIQSCKETSATLSLTVTGTAPLGPRQVTIKFGNGAANPITVEIVPIPPSLGDITPNIGAQGSTVTVTLPTFAAPLTGSPTAAVSGAGVTATTLDWNPSRLIASLSIAPDAPIGPRELTVISGNGVTNPRTFTVTPPTWPDLTVVLTVPLAAEGYDESFGVTIRNVGTKETTTPITVKFQMGPGDRFVAVNGVGWVCNAASNFVTCVTSKSIPANADDKFDLILNVKTGNASAEVISDEDYNVSNNKASKNVTTVSEPLPNIVLSTTSLQPGQQATVSLTIPGPFPHDLADSQNILTVSFAPATSGGAPDPALQFSTGGQAVAYTFRANALTADFQGIAGPIGFQPGTVSGTLTFKVTIKNKANVIKTRTVTAFVAARPPSISAVAREKTASGFNTAITMHSSTREVRTLTFQFNTTKPIQVSCGNISGCTATGSTITFDVASMFGAWYADNTVNGTIALLRVPFTLEGSLTGSVAVSLTNSLGLSNSMSFTIP